VRVEPSLRVAGHPRAFAVGDVAGADGGGPDAPPGRPPTAQVAFQQADYAAWNVWASVVGRPLLPFKYQHLGEMMSLGAGDGALTLPVGVPASLASALTSSPLAPLLDAAGVRLGDPGGVTLAGPLAGALRRAAYWYRQPTGGQRAAVGAEWLGAAAKRVGGRRGEGK
jgi:NADH dehydrogenase FAD-containing subunit